MWNSQQYNEATNTKDMITGALNRIAVTDDPEEILSLAESLKWYLNKLYQLNQLRLADNK